MCVKFIAPVLLFHSIKTTISQDKVNILKTYLHLFQFKKIFDTQHMLTLKIVD